MDVCCCCFECPVGKAEKYFDDSCSSYTGGDWYFLLNQCVDISIHVGQEARLRYECEGDVLTSSFWYGDNCIGDGLVDKEPYETGCKENEIKSCGGSYLLTEPVGDAPTPLPTTPAPTSPTSVDVTPRPVVADTTPLPTVADVSPSTTEE